MRDPARRLNALATVAATVVAALCLAGPGPAETFHAAPDVEAHTADAFLPNDLAWLPEPGGVTPVQWNFAGPYGVGAPAAWGNLIAAGAPGGAGVTVAARKHACHPIFRTRKRPNRSLAVPARVRTWGRPQPRVASRVRVSTVRETSRPWAPTRVRE